MSTAGEAVSSLMIECDNNEEFIIANLSSAVFNETLDLAFNEGEKICFKVNSLCNFKEIDLKSRKQCC